MAAESLNPRFQFSERSRHDGFNIAVVVACIALSLLARLYGCDAVSRAIANIQLARIRLRVNRVIAWRLNLPLELLGVTPKLNPAFTDASGGGASTRTNGFAPITRASYFKHADSRAQARIAIGDQGDLPSLS